MRILVVLGAVFALAGCGVDGEPEPPTMNGTIGVSSNGVFGGATVQRGPLSISVGSGRGCFSCW